MDLAIFSSAPLVLTCAELLDLGPIKQTSDDFFLPLYYYSDRKRMSVIARTPSGQLRLYCKGAVSISGVVGLADFLEEGCLAIVLLSKLLFTYPPGAAQSSNTVIGN